MDRRAILAAAKDDLHALIDRLEFGRLEHARNDIARYMSFLQTLSDLPDELSQREHPGGARGVESATLEQSADGGVSRHENETAEARHAAIVAKTVAERKTEKEQKTVEVEGNVAVEANVALEGDVGAYGIVAGEGATEVRQSANHGTPPEDGRPADGQGASLADSLADSLTGGSPSAEVRQAPDTQGGVGTQAQRAEDVQPSAAPARAGGVYPLSRLLAGGLAGPYFVPETMIRRLGLEHGDEVDVQDSGETLRNGKPSFSYALCAIGPRQPAEGRVENPLCLVRREGENWFAGEFPILQSDREKLRLEPGDVVDVAYWLHEAHRVRVVWKHETPPLPESSRQRGGGSRAGAKGGAHASGAAPVLAETPARLKPAAVPKSFGPATPTAFEAAKPGAPESAKLKPTGPATPKTPKHAGPKAAAPAKPRVAPTPAKSPLTGQHVLMVSGLPKASYYRRTFERLGAQCSSLTGNEKKDMLVAAIRRSDVVVLITSAVSHEAAFQVGRLCKELHVAYRPISRGGLQSVVQAAMEAQRRHRKAMS